MCFSSSSPFFVWSGLIFTTWNTYKFLYIFTFSLSLSHYTTNRYLFFLYREKNPPKKFTKPSHSRYLIYISLWHTYRFKSGLAVYGAETSLIFNTIMAVIKMQITFTTVSRHDTMPLIKNSVGK